MKGERERGKQREGMRVECKLKERKTKEGIIEVWTRERQGRRGRRRRKEEEEEDLKVRNRRSLKEREEKGGKD